MGEIVAGELGARPETRRAFQYARKRWNQSRHLGQVRRSVVAHGGQWSGAAATLWRARVFRALCHAMQYPAAGAPADHRAPVVAPPGWGVRGQFR